MKAHECKDIVREQKYLPVSAIGIPSEGQGIFFGRWNNQVEGRREPWTSPDQVDNFYFLGVDAHKLDKVLYG